MEIRLKAAMDYFIPLLFVELVIISFVSSQQCISKSTCHDCMQTLGCIWCSQPDFKDDRCFSQKSTTLCDSAYWIDLKNAADVITNKNLTVKSTHMGGSGSIYTNSTQENLIQVQPQYMKLQLRLFDPVRISMFYRQAVDAPVDLYYLMDLSNSMKDDKEKLSVLGTLLVDTMTNITSNFRLGFGSFVDKVVMPYVSTVPHNLEEPCSRCAAPYGFHNVMGLSQNTHRFSGEVNRANVSGNLDAPEGGFDAIMQSIVCRKEIGWREKARKLLVFSTDSAFHYAGDGKLGGIVKPNDGCCHLDDAGRFYTHSTVLDYPSVSQINLKVKENSVNVIFAVTSEQIDLYRSLGRHIEGSSCGTLSQDSSNVVQLVVDQYNKITSSVELKDTAALSYFKVTYYSKCMDEGGPLIQTNKCDGLKVGQTVEFHIEIEAIACPPDPQDWMQKFYIYPVGLSENLTVEVELLCACACEFPEYSEYVKKLSFDYCSGFGILKCGICDCDKEHFGPKCECSHKNKTDETSGCRPDNTTQIDCSGHGTCVCNHCECSPKDVFGGDFCECNHNACDRFNGLVCSGPTHGICECNNTCTCLEGWSGPTCQCTNSVEPCKAPNSTEICSGRGKCECGVCLCGNAEDGSRYSGLFCDRCPKCPGKCNDLKDCVQCRVFQTGVFSAEECEKNCSTLIIHVKEKIDVNDQNFCTFTDEQKCKFQYIYQYGEDRNLTVIVGENLECPPNPQILGVVFALIGSIVVVGIVLLLVWKFFTTINDRREFAKFDKERMMAKWDTGENPIYKQATSTFKNPTYIGK